MPWGVEDPAVELSRQSFAYLSWLVSEFQPTRVGFCFRNLQR